MEYKDLVKHHTQLIKDKNDNKWEVIETSDLEEICEAYHQAKLKLLSIGDVVDNKERTDVSKCCSKQKVQVSGGGLFLSCKNCGKVLT